MPAAKKTFYLSRILGNKVWAGDEAAGKLADLIVDVSAVRPRVIAVKLKMANKVKKIVDFADFTISKRSKQYYIECVNMRDIAVPAKIRCFSSSMCSINKSSICSGEKWSG